jgi:ketosteroid isomerase-like protein
MNYARMAALAAAFIAVAGCQKPADTSTDEATVRKAAPAFEAALNEGDATKLSAMYWDDALLLPPGAPGLTGSGPIGEFLGKQGADMKSAGLIMKLDEKTDVAVSGDLAYEGGTFTVTDASGAVVDKGKFLGVLQKRDGKWKYIRDTWNSDQPPAVAAPAPAVEAPPAG